MSCRDGQNVDQNELVDKDVSECADAREHDPSGLIHSLLCLAARRVLISGRLSATIQSLLGAPLQQRLWAFVELGYWPDIPDPTTFNEKLLHRKVCTDRELFTTNEDKWAASENVADRVGRDVLPEVYRSTDRPEMTPFDSLPDEYVVRPTHLCGAIEIVDEQDGPDEAALVRQCRG